LRTLRGGQHAARRHLSLAFSRMTGRCWSWNQHFFSCITVDSLGGRRSTCQSPTSAGSFSGSTGRSPELRSRVRLRAELCIRTLLRLALFKEELEMHHHPDCDVSLKLSVSFLTSSYLQLRRGEMHGIQPRH
jgi:hypothetical protein